MNLRKLCEIVVNNETCIDFLIIGVLFKKRSVYGALMKNHLYHFSIRCRTNELRLRNSREIVGSCNNKLK